MRRDVVARIGPRNDRVERFSLAIATAVVHALKMAGALNGPPDAGLSEDLGRREAPPPTHKRAGMSIEQVLSEYRTRRGADCTAESVLRMMSTLERFAEWSGWRVVTDMDFPTADAILAARRRGDNGIKWSGSTHDQAVSVLRKFGEWCRRMGHLPVNPFNDLEPCGEPAGDGARPLSAEQARAFLACDIDRHMASRRARGCSPLFWFLLFYTGLRYSEAKSIIWGAFVEDEHGPWIVTDPKWEGNKSGRKDEIPVHPQLWELLQQHRERVPHTSTDPVFPKAPNRETFHKSREAAEIPLVDPRFGNCTPHSLRKSFGTWLDAQNIPRGLVSSLMRHSETLAESRYIRHNPTESFKAIKMLPQIWVESISFYPQRTRKNALALDSGRKKCDDVSATVRDSRMTQHQPQSFEGSPAATHAREPLQVESSGTPAGLPLKGCGVSPEAASNGQNTSESGCRPLRAEWAESNPYPRQPESRDPLESEVVHALVNWLNRRGS